MRISEEAMEHELMRFTSMTLKQLETRLMKITNPVKLEAFRKTAYMVGERKLAALAKEKIEFFDSIN